MLSLKHQFLFIHIPKTAGNALQQALRPFSEDLFVTPQPHQDGLHRFEVRSPSLQTRKHSTLAEYQQQLDPAVFAELFKFTCIRNPWERCISYYFSPHRGAVNWSKDAFSRFISQEVKPAEHYALLPAARDQSPLQAFDAFDAIIRYEHLSSDFAAVAQQLKLSIAPLQRLNASTRKDHRSYYDDTLKQQVAELFAAEIERFNFSF